jgi:uroporphyrinogen decarboxylase
MWGCRHRWQEYPTGRYDEVTYNPLSDAETPDDLEKYRWPSADWFDFSGVSADCEELKGHATTAGSIYFSYYYAWLTGMEKHLSDLALTPELARAIIGRLTNFQVEYLSRLFEAGAGKIDMTYIGDDFGMQDRLLVGLPMWREFFAPSYRKVVSLAKDYGLKVFCHSDGSIRELIPDLIEVGIDILNPIQTKCKGMVPGELKDEFGDRLSFHGGVDNQELMPFGTPAKVREEVLHLIDTLGRGGGYIVAPCHNLQPVTPLENILTMYETAYREGRYS